jgi:molecular chaperone GrpE (heat shock protein)
MDESSEALAEGEEAELVETVCEELQSGYRIGDDIIRHAMVKLKMENATNISVGEKENK